MKKPTQPTKSMLKQASADCIAWKSSGNAARRYVADDAAAYALASLRLLATMPIAQDASKAGKRKHIEQGGAYIATDWYALMPTMSASTRPDQGMEKRLLAALAIYGERIGWGWLRTEQHGFALIRTA